MFDPHLQDEDIKKKKRRVLVALLFFLLGTASALPLAGVTGVPLAAAPQPTLELPTHTVAPADTPVSTDTPAPPTHAPTETSAPTATPQPTVTPRPTATSTPIPVPPTTTEEVPGGAGGGELEASATPTGAPTVAPTDTPVPPMPTPEEPGELPVTGADVGRSGRLVLGLATFSVGALMLAVGLALRGGETPAPTPRPVPAATDAQVAQERSEQLSGAGVPAWLALGLAVVGLVFIAGYTLRRTRRQ